jgi:hypothetical protein
MSAPVGYGSRDGSAPPAETRACPGCASALPSSRARYCSAACKQRAYRTRRLGPGPLTITPVVRARPARTVYECPVCGERYLGEQRCPDCHRFCRRLGPGGSCPHCEEPVLLADLLGGKVLL